MNITEQKVQDVWNPGLDNDEQLLSDALNSLTGFSQDQISPLVQLFENPKSKFALPGAMDLFNHDCLHILLGCGLQSYEECFVIGVAMGNDENLKLWHEKFWKFCAQYLYSGAFRVHGRQTLKYFDQGVAYGKKLKHKNLHQIEFREYLDQKVGDLRQMVSIDKGLLKSFIHVAEQSKSLSL
jgi:hypothetical protein